MEPTSRRRFIRLVLLGSAAGALGPSCPALSAPTLGHRAREGKPAGDPTATGPDSRVLGESFETCHRLRDGGAFPTVRPSREVDVVVVGGGPSGLVAAYRLRDRDVLLLEKEPVVGGNARADAWEEMPYAAGAIVTYAESPAMALYEELGLEPRRVEATGSRAVFVGDRLVEDLWGGGLAQLFPPRVETAIRKAREDLLAIDAEAHRERLDAVPFADLLRPYPPEVKEWFDQLLAWFAASTDQYSGYAGLYLARSQMGEGLGVLYPEGTSRGGSYTFPGGLSHAALAMAERIEEAGSGRVITAATVYRISQDDGGVTVSYLKDNEPFAVRARTAIVAAPKFITRYLIDDLPEEQRNAMGRMVYAPFLVGAVAARGIVSGQVRTARTVGAPIANLRDVSTRPDVQLFRCEMPMPAARRLLVLEDAYLQEYAQHVADYFEAIFPGSRRRIAEIRIWRRGHNWYIPVPGMVTEIQPAASRPVGRIILANADSLGPISEFGWALVAADRAVALALQQQEDHGG